MASDVLHVADQVARGELAGGHVHGHGQLTVAGVRAPPACRLPARRLEDPSSDGDDEAGLLGDRDEPIGGDDAEARVLPAQQRLEADDGAVVQLDHRLVHHTQLIALEGGGEVVLELQTLERGRPHARGRSAPNGLARLSWPGTWRRPRRAAATRRVDRRSADAMPMLADKVTRPSSSTTGTVSWRRMRSATATASPSGSSQRSMRIANSSPPRRATVSPGRAMRRTPGGRPRGGARRPRRGRTRR